MLESRKSLESVDNHMAEAKVEEGFVSSRDERPIGKNTSEQIVGEDGIKPTQELPRRSFIRDNAALLVAGGMIFLIMIAAISISVLLIKAPLHSNDPATALQDAFVEWESYTTELTVPRVIDMRAGGSLTLYMAKAEHSWGGGSGLTGDIYGYGETPETATFPGPTILVRKDIPVEITWVNSIEGSHILDRWIDPVLVLDSEKCDPTGTPTCPITIVHVHGVEAGPSEDGMPQFAFIKGQSRTDRYNNTQPSATLMYHDHAAGLTRLNVWAGLMGAYIIDDPADTALGVKPVFDVPLLIADRMVNATDGNLIYPNTAASQNPRVLRSFSDGQGDNRLWVPEAYGTVNTVNGVVRPYVVVPAEKARLRLLNGANARPYDISIPFSDRCHVVSRDGGLVRSPEKLPAETVMTFFPFERADLLCDFTGVAEGTTWTVADTSDVSWNNGTPEILQVRVGPPSGAAAPPPLAQRLSPIPDLRDLWSATDGASRVVTLGENVDGTGYPTYLYIAQDGAQKSFMAREQLLCQRGRVEQWTFLNPSADFHPFHWHLVHAQCGPTADTPRTNALKDVVPVPPADLSLDEITRLTTVAQVCYVGCAPANSLLTGTAPLSKDFGFPVDEPYVAHCHVLEHEENDMMSYFRLVD